MNPGSLGLAPSQHSLTFFKILPFVFKKGNTIRQGTCFLVLRFCFLFQENKFIFFRVPNLEGVLIWWSPNLQHLFFLFLLPSLFLIPPTLLSFAFYVHSFLFRRRFLPTHSLIKNIHTHIIQNKTMFKSLSTLALLVAVATQQASSQMTSQSALSTGIATVMLNLQGAQVIPQLLSADSFKLSALLQQTFGSTSNNVGQSLSIAQVADAPTLALQYNSAQQSAIENASYTVMTLDPGAATATAGNVVRHYLANNVTLSNGQLQNTTQAIAGWFSPAPPAGSGIHRYTTLVFSQPSNFNLPDSLAHYNATIDTDFDLSSYISQTNLGSVIAATFFLCSNSSTAASSSVVPVATTAVGSSAIQAAAATVSVSFLSLSSTR